MTFRRVALVLAALCSAGCSHSTPPPHIVIPPTTTPAAPRPHLPVGVFGDGRYEVGVDILPGQYKTVGPDVAELPEKCYWARLKDLTGAITSVTAMQYDIKGPDVVLIEPTDKGFETRACGVWTRVVR